ncbi:MAG: PDZ domain-containing protein [Flavobacteriales bacterium]|nr:PDZ domain-containing protein [Flavobacteriia bacterium]NCP07026.1 PDZ domain-containing protein [Flavobacteriales bacterium]PIV93543.1 MAG: serine protease [Flavobacteriaceae bacterium CG17_big_fil_post_rev_8_21_14_2_50_33_15]PIY09696.1 MAG: serine protease [Flavobacteriaceae bacterium CG_4_10_14_3_um_filter_33_47]PJB16582.1 MAG: serine protease [Flavobacteriaceae bacterium CG_4_9_14_3_um_filter_33_16]
MKKILTLVCVSALGGILTLGAYKLFLDDSNNAILAQTETSPVFLPTTNVSAVKSIYNAPDLTLAAENSIHTVVHVKNLSVSSGQMTIEDLFYGRRPQRAQIGTGSGVIITGDGYIITNSHVIDNSQELSVTLNNNKTYPAKIIGSDSKTDIALLKIEADEALPYATFGDSDQAKIGEWVLAVGNPFNLTSTVTAGIISAKSRDLTGSNTQSFIQTDAAVNPGNSGGALVNNNGELIGINTAISSQTGSYIGYSFAVPSNIARKVIEDIMEYGNVQNGILGITGGALNSGIAEKIGVEDTEGVFIDSVVEDSGAEKAGLKNGDIIKEIDNIKVSKFSDLTGHLSSKRPNDVVNLTIIRNGTLKTIPVTLYKNNTITLPLVGQVKNAKSEDLKKLKASNGVKIVQLDSKYESYWKNNGVEEGSIITAINDIEIKNIEDAQNILKKRSSYDPLRIELINTNGEKERYNFK